jgi:cobalt/nickel transport system permease protein
MIRAFLEDCGPKGGFLREMDARAKVIFSALCMLVAVSSHGVAAPAACGFVCLGLLAISGVRAKVVFFRLAAPIGAAVFIALLQGISVSGGHIGFSDGWASRGALVVGRVFGAVSSVIFLSMTTPAHRLISAAASLKLPRALAEVCMFTYRYVFVLFEDAVTIYQAQKGRLGYSNFSIGIKSIGTLCGAVFLRAFSQAEATGQAMLMRGYSGEYIPAFREKLRGADALTLSAAFIPCLAVFLWTL